MLTRFAALFGLALMSLLSPALAQGAGEQLFVLPPKDWIVVFHETKDGVELTELTPKGQTAKEWTDMLAIRIVAGKPGKSPQDFLKDLQKEVEAACDQAGAGPVSPASENGYDTAIRAVACPKSKIDSQGELSLIKVLRGEEAMYIVSRAWRGAAFEKDKLPVGPETTRQWLEMMGKTLLCDPKQPDRHPCPRPAGTNKP